MNKSCWSFAKINKSLLSNQRNEFPPSGLSLRFSIYERKIVQNTWIKQNQINVAFRTGTVPYSTAETLSKLDLIRRCTDSMFSIFLLFRIGPTGSMDWDTDSESGSWTTKLAPGPPPPPPWKQKMKKEKYIALLMLFKNRYCFNCQYFKLFDLKTYGSGCNKNSRILIQKNPETRDRNTRRSVYILAYLEMSPLIVCYDRLTGATAVLGVQRVPGVEAALEFLHLGMSLERPPFPGCSQYQISSSSKQCCESGSGPATALNAHGSGLRGTACYLRYISKKGIVKN